MRPKPTLALALAAVLAVGASAAPLPAASKAPPRTGRHQQCFYSRDINGFRAADDSHVYIRVGVRDIYAFTLLGPCPDVKWTEHLALKTTGSNFICSGLDADLIVPSSIGPQRCPVRDIRKLTPEEAKALPAKLRP
jgi:hypothetical protein